MLFLLHEAAERQWGQSQCPRTKGKAGTSESLPPRAALPQASLQEAETH